ncbi:putative Proline dehydrogenase / Delta-1-pyrroline-5-carboxylate dehydrogenase [Burkholderia sp. IT-111MI5]
MGAAGRLILVPWGKRLPRFPHTSKPGDTSGPYRRPGARSHGGAPSGIQNDRRRRRARARGGARQRRVVPVRGAAAADEAVDAARRRACDPRHADLVRGDRGQRCARVACLARAFGVGDPRVLRVRHALLQPGRLALARMRARHRVSHALDERRAVPGRVVPGVPPRDGMALEPCAPSHRHAGRRTRSGNRRAEADRLARARAERRRAEACGRRTAQDDCSRVHRPARRRGAHLRARIGMAEGRARVAHPSGGLCARGRCFAVPAHAPAAALHRLAEPLRRVAVPVLRPHAARGHARERARSSAQLPHRDDESGVPLPVLEHELPRRAPHVPDGAVPRAAEAARGREGRHAAAVPQHARRVCGDRAGAGPADARPVPLRRAAGAGHGARVIDIEQPKQGDTHHDAMDRHRRARRHRR